MELVHRAGSLSGTGRESVDVRSHRLEHRLHELSTALHGISWTGRLEEIFPSYGMIQEDRGTCNDHRVQRMTRHVLNGPFELMRRHTLLETRINLRLLLHQN
jgi:hypothetical protein